MGYDVPVSEKQAQRAEVTHPKHPAGDGEKQLGARPCTLGGELEEGGIAKVQSDLWSSGLGWAGTAVTAISSRSDRSREHSCVRLWQSGRSGLVPVALVSALAAFSRPTPFVGTRQDPRAPPSLAKGLRLQLQPQVWLVGREGVTSPPSPAPRLSHQPGGSAHPHLRVENAPPWSSRGTQGIFSGVLSPLPQRPCPQHNLVPKSLQSRTAFCPLTLPWHTLNT